MPPPISESIFIVNSLRTAYIDSVPSSPSESAPSGALSPQEALEVAQLVYRYGFAADERDWAAIGNIFTEDALFDASAVGGPSVRGVETIIEHLAKRAVPTAHIFTNAIVTGTDEGAVVRSKAMNPDPEGKVVVTTVRHTAVRTPRGWRLSSQVAESLLRPGPDLRRS